MYAILPRDTGKNAKYSFVIETRDMHRWQLVYSVFKNNVQTVSQKWPPSSGSWKQTTVALCPFSIWTTSNFIQHNQTNKNSITHLEGQRGWLVWLSSATEFWIPLLRNTSENTLWQLLEIMSWLLSLCEGTACGHICLFVCYWGADLQAG